MVNVFNKLKQRINKGWDYLATPKATPEQALAWQELVRQATELKKALAEEGIEVKL